MRGQVFERVVLLLELFIFDRSVDVSVAGAAQQRDTVLHLPPVERLPGALLLVPRPWDEVVPRQLAYRPAAELALAGAFLDGYFPLPVQRLLPFSSSASTRRSASAPVSTSVVS